MKLLIISLLLAACAFAQQPHSVKLSWVASIDQILGMTYTVHRAVGDCTSNPTLTPLVTGVVGLTYEDLAVAPKTTYCYAVTAVLAGAESTYSNKVTTAIPLGGPTNLKADQVK